jgi:4-amino-4-deoxy-L-arabinose transferase-like glycosyltransferase
MDTLEFVEKREAYKFGFYLWTPQWSSYDTRPRRISAFLFAILSLLPWYTINPFNGYLVRKNKWFSMKDLSDFIYNPFEHTDALLSDELKMDYRPKNYSGGTTYNGEQKGIYNF